MPSLADFLAAYGGSPDPENPSSGEITPGLVLRAIQAADVGGGQAFGKMATDIATLPKRAIEGAAAYQPGIRREDVTDIPGSAQPADVAVGPATEAAMTLAGVGTGFAQPGSAGIFGGRLARNAPKEAYAKADEMLAKGATREEIYNATGLTLGPDQMLRHEIPDYGTKFTDLGTTIAEAGGQTTAGRAFKHPELFKAYPELKKMALKFEDPLPSSPGSFGGYSKSEKALYLNADAFTPENLANYLMTPEQASRIEPGVAGMRSSLLHELQHGVQGIEGFAAGGNPNMPIVRQAADAAIAKNTAAAQEKLDALHAQRDAYVKSQIDVGRTESPTLIAKEFWDANPEMIGESGRLHYQIYEGGRGPARSRALQDAYQSLAGEAEARNVQYRRDLTPEQLAERPPWQTQNIPYSEQLLRFTDRAGEDIPRNLQLERLPPEDVSGPITGVGRPYIRPENRPLFDYSRLSDVPSVPQRDLPRVVPPQGVPEETQALASPKNIARVNEAVKAGEAMGGREWYNAEPLRQQFVSELGEGPGNAAFRQYMETVASTSPRTKIPENIRNASYYYGLLQRGEDLPRTYLQGGYHRMVKETQAPSPYGAMPIHIQNLQNVREGGLPVLQNPKPSSFVENLTGNQTPVTIDTHNMRLLTGAREAEVPKPNEYGFLERMQQDEARKLGMTPAQYQASAWIGAGGETGLKSPTDPFLRVFEDRVALTAERRGQTKAQVLRDFIRGHAPLLSLTPAAVLLGQGQPAPEPAQ